MPSGYTSNLYDGKDQTFKEFALDCARAFGALITLRDEPRTPIPDEFVPDPYYKKQISMATERLNAILEVSDEEATIRAQEEYDSWLAERQRSNEESNALRKRYEEMLRRAKSWTPPTPDHEGLKNFMIEQLETSIKYDCHEYTYESPLLSGKEWRAKRIVEAKSNLGYYTQQYEKEIERCRERTNWVRALRESLEDN